MRPNAADVRVLSVLWALLASLIVCWRARSYDKGARGTTAYLMTMCFLFYLNVTFQLKHHTLSLVLVLLAYVCWDLYGRERSSAVRRSS